MGLQTPKYNIVFNESISGWRDDYVILLKYKIKNT